MAKKSISEVDHLLGKMSDVAIAKQFARSVYVVRARRSKLGIERFSPGTLEESDNTKLLHGWFLKNNDRQ